MRPQVEKRLLVPDRVRRITDGFSWIDRRFVRERLIEPLTRDEVLLYFFLVAVADQRGLSFYGDLAIGRILKLSPADLDGARRGLVGTDLVAFERPLYQVLSLPARGVAPARPQTIGEVLRELAGGAEGRS
jgi:hypothetical protein